MGDVAAFRSRRVRESRTPSLVEPARSGVFHTPLARVREVSVGNRYASTPPDTLEF